MNAIITTDFLKNTIEILDDEGAEILQLTDEQYELLANSLDQLIDPQDTGNSETEYVINDGIQRETEDDEEYDRFDDLCYKYNI